MTKNKVVEKCPKKVSSIQKTTSHRRMHPDLTYAYATLALLKAKGDMGKAIIEFKQMAPRPYPDHLREFLVRAWDHYKNGDIKVSFRAPPKRSKKVSDEQARQASNFFLQGSQGLSGWRPSANAKEVSYSFFL